jgi:hypothetical protein
MSATLSLGSIAKALGGEVSGGQILAPGPGHSPRDRSLSVRVEPNAPDGVLVHSFAADDWRACRDHVKARLGIEPERERKGGEFSRPRSVLAEVLPPDRDAEQRRRWALDIWHNSRDPRGTAVEFYLASRGLSLGEDVAGTVLRFAERCPWKNKATGSNEFHPAMVALMRHVGTGEPKAIHRTLLFLNGKPQLEPSGEKRRRMFGDSAECAVMLDPFEAVTLSLTVGEGIETVMSARVFGFAPAWAMGTVSTVSTLRVLAGVEALNLLAESDKRGANAKAIAACSARWLAGGREVNAVEPIGGGDFNDVLRKARAD